MILNLIMIVLYVLISLTKQGKPLRVLLPFVFIDVFIDRLNLSEYWFYISLGILWTLPIAKIGRDNLLSGIAVAMLSMYYIYLSVEVFLYDLGLNYVTIAYTNYMYILATIHIMIILSCVGKGLLNGLSNLKNINNRSKNSLDSLRIDSAKKEFKIYL